MKMDSGSNILRNVGDILSHSEYIYRFTPSSENGEKNRVYYLNVFGELLIVHLDWCDSYMDCKMCSGIGNASGSIETDDLCRQVIVFEIERSTSNAIVQAVREFAGRVQSARQVKSLAEMDKKLELLLKSK